MASFTYKNKAAKEDVSPIITNVSPDLTFLVSKFGKTEVSAMFHEWLSDSIRGPRENAQAEKVDFTSEEATDREREGNYCQQYMEGIYVTDAQEKIAKHGVASEMSYQMLNKSKAVARDLEYAVLKSATAVRMAAGTPGKMGGLRYFLGGKNTVKFTAVAATDTLATVADHGFRKSQIVTLYKAAAGTMPAGLTNNMHYYVGFGKAGVDEVADLAKNFKVYLTIEDSEAGVNPVDLTDAGAGDLYVTPANIISLNDVLDEVDFNDLMEKCWVQGANIDSAIVSGKRKRQISGWTAGAQKTMSASERKAGSVIDIYESDHGTINIEAHRMQDDSRIDFIEYQYWKLGYLIPFHVEDIVRKGTYKEKAITGIVTLECKSPISNGSLVNITG